jgi:hypothetical protein
MNAPLPTLRQNSISVHFASCLSIDSIANAIAQIAWDKDRVFDRELALIGARAAIKAINAAAEHSGA